MASPSRNQHPSWTLDDPRARAPEHAGGKGASLARLAHAGLVVPDAVIVPVGALTEALERAGLASFAATVDRTRAARLRDEVRRLALPPGWAQAWRDAAIRLGGRVTVRSSAVDEDGSARTFAGVHDSVLGVAPADVAEAVKQVWASLYADRAFVYRGDSARPPGMAVVIQRQVPAACAGVAFTLDPTTGSRRHGVVEAVWGLGEVLVSGRVTPQSIVLRRPRRTLWRHGTPQVVLSTPHAQRSWNPDGEGVRPLPDRLGDQQPLDEDHAARVLTMALRTEAVVGGPSDIEWVQDPSGTLFVVQARPIVVGRPMTSDTLWTRRFLGERWTGPATPMGWSLVEPALSRHIAYPKTQARHLGGGPALRLVDGHPYVNATVFRHLLFTLPGLAPPRFLLEMLPSAEAERWRARRIGLPRLGTYAGLLGETWSERRWERFAWNPLDNPRRWWALRHRLATELPRLREGVRTAQGAVEAVAILRQLLDDYVGVHVVSLLYANVCYQLLEGALAHALPDAPASLVNDLLAAPGTNHTVRLDEDLWHLAHDATDADLDALGGGAPLRPAFADALRDFLGRHGDRASSSWEVFSPRWRDNPSALAPLLRARRRGQEDPLARRHATQQRQRQALRQLRRTLPAWTLPGVLGPLWYTRRYLLLRENQRHAFDGLQHTLATTLRGAGATLVAEGALDRADDIAFLTWGEAREALSARIDPATTRHRAAQAREAHAVHQRIHPPVTLDAPRPPPDADRMVGVPMAPGTAHGRVHRVRNDADAATLQPGDILVASAIDPAWAPMLAVAAGAVVELGGALSHAAVVARELGVPMVGDVHNVLERLAQGEWIHLDGQRGVVWRHRGDDPSRSAPGMPI